ncbi:hypothetical protein L1987_19587 [Smallanthus sonchifolius]|uniref:Uncharacterized protein n=1 Tax=Smallanthus sonchifolius TaxID=185202 RepID=A0ACB9ISF3_9ASTR|nr:hypothetical protein L1987_19587 [Smallanthus sonchifolius]
MIFRFLLVFYASITCTLAADTVSANQTVRYNETIVSPQETFELGFFRPGRGKGRQENKVPGRSMERTQREIYFQYNLIDTSVFTRLVLQPSGRLERLLWIDSEQEWRVYTSLQIDQCDQYAACGPYGICNIINSPVCECLKGFEPTSPDEWRNTVWSQGCRHTIPLDCKPGEGFNKYPNLKLPDTQGSWYNQTMTLEGCTEMCKRNCSCTAYTNSNISGTGMAVCYDSIENNRSSTARRNAGRRVPVIVPIAFVVWVILVSICLFCHFYRKKQQQQGIPRNESGHDPENICSHYLACQQ